MLACACSEKAGPPPRSKAQTWFDAFRGYPQQSLPVDSTWRAWAVPKPKATAASWTFLGPRNLLHDNLYGSPVTAGRVNAVVATGDALYAAADRGGVWRSNDEGENWLPLTDHLPFPNITAITSMDRSIFAGTGHGVILRSADDGSSWDFTPVPGTRVSALHVAQNNVFAGLEGYGVVRSRDQGRSFTSVLALPDAIPASIVSDGETIYVAASALKNTSTHQSIFRSNDGGDSWTRVNPPGIDTGMRTLRLALAPSNRRVLYLMSSSTAKLEGLYRSEDGGDTWQSVRTRFPENVCATINGPCPPMEVIAVHPHDPQTVFVGRVWLYRSIDGGEHFEDINKSATGVVPHVDHRAIAFSPDGERIYDANDGGIWTATSTGNDWRHLNTNLGITQFYPGMSLHPTDPNQLLAGTQDNSFVLWQNGIWKSGFTGDFMWTQIDPRNPSTAFAVLYPGREMVVRTRNQWADFTYLANGIDTERAPWVSPLEMDASNPDRLYFGTVRVFRTENQGDRWQAISGELGPITALSVALRDSGRVYAAVNNTVHAYRGGMTWENIGAPATRNISRILSREREIYVSYSGLRSMDGKGHVYYSPDAGASWIDRTGQLPDCPVNDLLFDPDVEETLYAATDLGVYRSLDRGESWEILGAGLPLTTVTSIRIHRPTRLLRAATYGRGIWQLPLN